MEAMRKSWTDERLDDFRGDVNRRFDEAREETSRRFDKAREETNRRFDDAREETNRRFDDAREETNRRFDEVGARLDNQDVELHRINDRLDGLAKVMIYGYVTMTAAVVAALLAN